MSTVNHRAASKNSKPSPDSVYPFPKALLMMVLWFVGASTVCSLAFSLWVRDWTTLSNVGQFWAGHIGNMAILFLAWSVYIQNREFAEQRRESRMIQRQYDQGNIHALMRYLDDMSSKLSFSVHHRIEDATWRESVNSIQSICGLLQQGKRTRDEDVLRVYVTDGRLLKRYISLIEEFKTGGFSLAGFGPDPIVDKFCELIYCPPVFREFIDDFLGEQAGSLENIEKLHLAEDLKSRLLDKVEQGWRFEALDVRDRRFLSLHHDDAGVEYGTSAIRGTNVEEKVRALLLESEIGASNGVAPPSASSKRACCFIDAFQRHVLNGDQDGMAVPGKSIGNKDEQKADSRSVLCGCHTGHCLLHDAVSFAETQQCGSGLIGESQGGRKPARGPEPESSHSKER